MYKIWLVNFSYYSEKQFDNLEDAVKWVKETTFDCRIDKGSESICSVSYFGGTRYYSK